MSDDLVKRLRYLGDHASFEPHMHHTAADRIEELEATGLANRVAITRLEAKLAKLEAAAQKAVGHITGYGEASTARIELRTTLAELTGGKDE